MTITRQILVTAQAPDTLYAKPIVLYADTWSNHIQPFKATVTVGAITAVINDIHEVYEEQGNKDRHFLINYSVATQSGKTLTVVVDPLSQEPHVPVCTAFYNRQPKIGPRIWAKSEMETAIRTSYDSDHDILYLAVGRFKSEEEEFLESGVLLGFEEDSTEPKAATIMRFSARPKEERRRLADRLAELFHMARGEVGAALGAD